MFRRIDHIGIAVPEIESALSLWEERFELEVSEREVIPEQGVEAVLLDLGESHIELLAPLAQGTPVGRFLRRRGQGLHHVAYEVDDIDVTLALLRETGMRLIDERPRPGMRASRVAFLHPGSAGGVLTEIVELAAVRGGR